MSKRIPKEFIAQVLERSDIAELIGARIQLKQRANEYIACCPFHQEKSPSFSVSPQKQFYYCFGCHAHGNAIDFLMNYENLEFVEAVRTLANRAGLELKESTTENSQHDALYPLMQQASTYYQNKLRSSQRAIAYLKKRGINGTIAKKFALGYADTQWQQLQTAVENKNNAQTLQQLETCGLLINKTNKTYDRFRDRIMFPIHNMRGKCVGFGGRIINPEDTPKYLNSPETPLFHKSNILYGLYEARIDRCTEFIVVEGYMDVIALAQHGITGAVACLGTALTAQHIRLMQRYGKRITLCFDGDSAGQRASWRALQTALPLLCAEVNLHFLSLPTEHDPDSYVRDFGKDKFMKLIAAAPTITETLLENLSQQYPLTTVENRINFATQACELCAMIPEGLYHTSLLLEISKLSSLPLEQLQANAKRKLQNPPTATNKTIETPQTKQALTNTATATETETTTNEAIDEKQTKTVAQLLAWIIYDPKLATIEHKLQDLANQQHPTLQTLQQVISHCCSNNATQGGQVLAIISDKQLRNLVSIHLGTIYKLQDANPEAAWQDLNRQLLRQNIEYRIDKLLSAGRARGLQAAESDLLKQLIEKKRNYQTI